MSQQLADRNAARQWARNILATPRLLILDTETTGLDHQAEIVQIALIDTAGQTRYNSLVRPTKPIPAAASRIHGITDARIELECAKSWAEVESSLLPLLLGRTLVIYNADYDTRIIEQTYRANGVMLAPPPLIVAPHSFECAMHWYSQYVGEWNGFHGNYRWQRLPAGDHSALGDCLATLKIIKQMAAE